MDALFSTLDNNNNFIQSNLISDVYTIDINYELFSEIIIFIYCFSKHLNNAFFK